jgi:carboxylesterase type B
VRETASGAKRTQPLYYYQFSYDGALGFFKKKLGIDRAGDKVHRKINIRKRARGMKSIFNRYFGFEGACHTDELSYLFTRHMTPWRELAGDADLKIIDRMTLMWTNFAKHGFVNNFLHP